MLMVKRHREFVRFGDKNDDGDDKDLDGEEFVSLLEIVARKLSHLQSRAGASSEWLR